MSIVGEGQLAQTTMEDFFCNDDLFVPATPGFFAGEPLVTASG